MTKGMKKGPGLYLFILLIALLLAGIFYARQKDIQPPAESPSATANVTPLPAPPAEEVESPVPPVTEETKTTAPSAEPFDNAFNLERATSDRVLGNQNAPVTIVEFASLTCSHCAHFANDVLPQVKKDLIETGKAKIIFRDFPLDNMALKAAMMARCADPAQYFDLLEVLFKNQERWARNEDPVKALKQLGSLAGMNEELIDTCMSNEELQNALLKTMQDAQSAYQVGSTPTFIFNNGAEKFSGAETPEKFKDVVEKLTKQ